MIKRKIISILVVLTIYLNALPIVTYANENDVYELYKQAVLATMASGSWTEGMSMTADMNISKGSAKTKTKAVITSDMNISNYSENDLSGIKMSGSADMSIMGQTYAWDILYENGIAHYNYTKPDQKSVDIEMNPGCFNFNALTQDMVENAKSFKNKITFTIPGNKMEQVGIAAVNLMSGVENLNYGNVDVEIITESETGTIDQMILKFHAAMTYQGYDAEVDYYIDYSFSTNVNTDISEDNNGEMKLEDGLVIYSDNANLSIGKDSDITLSVGSVINGEQIKDVSKISFLTEDSSIVSVSDTGIQNNLRYVKFKGTNIGTTQVIFSDSNTGYTAKVPITVYANNYLSYTLDSVPSQNIEKYTTNFYNVNGLYIDSYTYSVNKDKSAEVSFDVYNTNYTYGVVEVYDESGNLKHAVLINKMSSPNTSIKKVLWDSTGCLIRDAVKGNLLTYRQESAFSKLTQVIVKIPENGYIKICNDPKESSIVNIVNSVDILMSIGKLADKVKKYNGNSDEFAKKLTLKLVTEKTYCMLVKDGSKFSDDLWKGVSKEVFFSTESLGDFCNTVAKNLTDLDLGKLIEETAVDFGCDIGEDIFKYFSGPIKMVFDGIFAFGKIENIAMQHIDFVKASDAGSIYIQNQCSEIRSSHQIKVESNDGFSPDMALNVFKVTLDSEVLDQLRENNVEVYDAIVDGMSYTYDISLLKNGEEIQPESKVTVYIPIPKDMEMLAYTGKAKIYRVEENGNLTEMNTQLKDGCFVFDTSHFSLYTLVADGANNMMLSLNNIIIVVIGIIGVAALLVNIKKRKKSA